MTDTRAEPKPAPCLFCVGKVGTVSFGDGRQTVCLMHGCEYRAASQHNEAEAIAAHNRVARAGDLPSAEELERAMFNCPPDCLGAHGVAGAPKDALDAIQKWRREREEGGDGV